MTQLEGNEYMLKNDDKSDLHIILILFVIYQIKTSFSLKEFQ